MTLRMPFTPRAQPGEAPLSLLRRGALGNGHVSTLRFAFALNPDLDHAPAALGTLARSPELFHKTCSAMGVPDDEIHSVSYQRIGAAREDDLVWLSLRVGIGELQFRRAKLCMACYQELGYALAEWDHIAATACARHGTLLSDSCPCCSTPWTHRHDPLGCGCDPTEIIRQQQHCDSGAATLLNRIIQAADNKAIRMLGRLWSVIEAWKGLGMTLSRKVTADALHSLYAGEWPRLRTSDNPDANIRLHPRIGLAPLLTDEIPERVIHAEQMLRHPAPAWWISCKDELTWPASTAMAALGIGRLTFDRLVSERRLVLDSQKRVSVLAVNSLLHEREVATNPVMGGELHADRTPDDHQHSAAAMHPATNTGRGSATKRASIDDAERTFAHVTTPDLRKSATGLITISEAAKRLRTNTNSVRGVIHAGLLAATKGTADSGVRWNIDAYALDAFDATYVFASAVVAQFAHLRTTIASRLQSAGLKPISGPGIDGGVTFVFRRADFADLDMDAVLHGGYKSSAGRKKASAKPSNDSGQSCSKTASILKIPGRRLRDVVAAGWIEPLDRHARKWTFDATKTASLAQNIRINYVDLEIASQATGQTIHAFRRTWIYTGFAAVHRLADRELITVTDLRRIESTWSQMATSSAIGQDLGRSRSLCPNLQKMGELEPAAVIGSGHQKIRLFPRSAAPLARFQIRQS